MNSILGNLQNKLAEDYFFEKEYITDDEHKEIVSEGGSLEDLGYTFDYTNNKWYKKVHVSLTDSETEKFITMKMLDMTKAMNQNLITMKNIMIFWLVLTIINLIGGLFIAARVLR